MHCVNAGDRQSVIEQVTYCVGACFLVFMHRLRGGGRGADGVAVVRRFITRSVADDELLHPLVHLLPHCEALPWHLQHVNIRLVWLVSVGCHGGNVLLGV
jgi:hypothetical protein